MIINMLTAWVDVCYNWYCLFCIFGGWGPLLSNLVSLLLPYIWKGDVIVAISSYSVKCSRVVHLFVKVVELLAYRRYYLFISYGCRARMFFFGMSVRAMVL